jgi:signal transduction histidine kinase
MKTASQLDALTRENARLRGDLKTIATRISHDLRTPLGGIITPGEVLKEVLKEKEPSLVSFADSMLDSAEEISKLLTRVSFVAKASSNPIPKRLLAMSEVVSEILQRLESLKLKKNATVTSPDSWPEVHGVATWLGTIWWNLLTNAMQHGGKSPQVEIGWVQEQGRKRFWVRDNGCGVTDRTLKLFQPFDSLHELNSSQGLGLSIVQRLVELQGGECGHEPQAQGGAFFFFTLPDVGDPS